MTGLIHPAGFSLGYKYGMFDPAIMKDLHFDTMEFAMSYVLTIPLFVGWFILVLNLRKSISKINAFRHLINTNMVELDIKKGKTLKLEGQQ